MALTATLALDIRAFEGGLSKATDKLDVFAQKTVKNTSRDLSRLLEDFTGQKVVAEAARMAEAVERIGGASKLTEAEQRRVNAAVSDAIAKYDALGQQAPAHLLKLQQETAGAVQKTSLLTQGMQVLVGLFSARAILRAAGDVLEFTGNLTDLAGKTGITTTELQKLQYVTAQSGVGMEELARGAVKLGQNLVSGNKSAVEGVKALGFEVSALTAMNPGDAFLQIGQAIAAVPNPMERAALAVGIFGKAGADFLPAFTTDMKALADQAEASGAILSEDMVKAGDDAGDAITRLQAAGMSLMSQFLIPVLPAVEALANMLSANLPSALAASRGAFDQLLRKGLEFEVWLAQTAASITATAASVPLLGRVFGQTSTDVDFFNQKAQIAKDTLKLFDLEGVKPATASMQAAIPMTTGYAEALENAGKKAKKKAEDLSVVSGLVDPLTQMLIEGTLVLDQWGAESREAALQMDALAMAVARANGTLIQFMPVLKSTFKGSEFIPFNAAVKEADTSTRSFFQKFKDGMSEAGMGASGLSSLFAQAFVGGGGALGAIKAFATQGIATLLDMIPGVGPWISAFAGPIVAMLSKLTAKFKALFGGPSASEVEGRSLVADFESDLADSLTAAQRAEAGTDAWKQTVIALRDAYIAAGRTEEEALADAKKLWESSKKGAEESAKVIADIKKKLDGLPTEKNIDVNVNYQEHGTPPAVGATSTGSGFATGESAQAYVNRLPTPTTGGTITVPVYLDGFQIAMAVAPHRQAANRRWGV